MTKNMVKWRLVLMWGLVENWYHFREGLLVTDDFLDIFESLCEAFPFTGNVLVWILAFVSVNDNWLLRSTLELLSRLELTLDEIVVVLRVNSWRINDCCRSSLRHWISWVIDMQWKLTSNPTTKPESN